MPSPIPSIQFADVSFAWPDGKVVLDHVNATLAAGRTGVIGANGAGKTTMLRLLRGELVPTSGHLTVAGPVAYLPQRLTVHSRDRVAELLGVAGALDAVRAIERGEATPELFDAVGDAWDVEARSLAALGEVGLAQLATEPAILDRHVDELSGGEAMQVALAGLVAARAPVTILDEPTNNLDRESRQRVYGLVRAWRGTLLVVSHDAELLELMDQTVELRAGAVAVFGGPVSAYREQVAREQQAVERDVRDAEQRLRAEKRQRIEAETKLARRANTGKKAFENKQFTAAVRDKKKASAEASAGKTRAAAAASVQDAAAAVARAEARLREDRHIRIDLPDPDVGTGRRLAELSDGRRTLVLQGPERVGLVGANGVGKTRLLEQLACGTGATSGADLSSQSPTGIILTQRVGYLPQRIALGDESVTVSEAVSVAVPGASPQQVRAQLARFLFRGDTTERPVSALSGGERFRLALARILLASPPAQLLLLDEPTNSLDMESIEQLVEALAAYRGGLLVVSHDATFLRRIGVTRIVELGRDRLLTERAVDATERSF